MAEPCSLEKSAFSLKLIREAATESFCQLLGSLNLGDVELFVEARLLSLFHYFANVGGDDLHSLCVRDIHSLMLPSAHPMPRSTVVYMIRPRTAHVHLVAQHLQQLPAGTSAVLFHTGSWNALCTDVLVRAGVDKQVVVHAYKLGFIPLDNDILTLAHDTALRDCYIHGNKTCLTELGHALHVLQQTAGDIPTVHYKGELSKAVWKALSEFNATTPPPATRLKKLCIDHMILLDRKLDYIAPLSTPLTHEALLAELLGLQDGVVTVGAAPSADGDAATSAAPSSTVGEQVTWALNGDDPVFQDIRDKHIQAIGPYLHSTSAVFAEERKHMERLLHAESTTVKQLDELGASMNQHMDKVAMLSKHIALAELVQATTKSKSFKNLWQLEKAILERQPHLGDIEALVWQLTPAYTVLRMLCLHSLANQGLPKASYMQLKTQCLHLYGYEYLHVFESLEAMGLLTTGSTAAAPPTTTPTNPLVAWDLTGHFDCDPCNPDDASFVAGGYCPLLIKLVQAALSRDGWTPLTARLNMLPGPSAVLAAASKPKRTKRVLVVVVGGISPLEISALRFLGKKLKVSFIVASDAILSGKAFMGQALEPMGNGLQ
ncbi:hypothetical protein, variant [Aphanomyces invadans]|uniref:Uncharacterized protein n=1 Tax=Aphanomyces invadans TaxID=157072 RepID=A0A024UDH8_9STRA|nr:hypothetical protein, variant [Aphanomyces invadans]ETW03698.1 hypothetical protein, variant [Aphanomyces invadans]|eukprot:XP_008867927.1 hypothetical protein, variant [Aphanomyces invadans]